MNDPWTIAAIIYGALVVLTFLPVFPPLLRKVKLKPGGSAFAESPHFTEDNKALLEQHYSRINGTLVFWKNQAAKYEAFHIYCLFWTIPSAVIIPVLAQSVSDENADSVKLLLTLVSAVTAVLLAFHRGFKIEENFKGFRHGESEFYDLYRRLLDRPQSFGESEEERIEMYFQEVEVIRRFVRNTETNNFATLDETKKKIEQIKA